MHICLVHGLVEYPWKFGFRPILGQWRSIPWRFSAILHFGAMEPDFQLFLLHLRTVFFEAHLWSPLQIWQLWFQESYKFSLNPPVPSLLSFCYTLMHKSHTHTEARVPFPVFFFILHLLVASNVHVNLNQGLDQGNFWSQISKTRQLPE